RVLAGRKPLMTPAAWSLGSMTAVLIGSVAAIATAVQAADEPPTPGAGVTAPGSSSGAAAPAQDAATRANALDRLGWLRGCWQGSVNQRQFRELWLSPSGGMMLGAGQTVLQGKTIDFQYLRLELADDGSVKYVIVPNGSPQVSYKLSSTTKDEF